MKLLHEPIEDFSVPTLAQAQRLVGELELGLRQGERLAIHCWAGLGRSGTIAACWQVGRGMKPRDAIALVRWIRPGAIQNRAQEQFVLDFTPGAEAAP